MTVIDHDAACHYEMMVLAVSVWVSGLAGGVQVRLVRPGTWKGIWSYALGPAEDALCVKAMQLKNAKSGVPPKG